MPAIDVKSLSFMSNLQKLSEDANAPTIID